MPLRFCINHFVKFTAVVLQSNTEYIIVVSQLYTTKYRVLILMLTGLVCDVQDLLHQKVEENFSQPCL